MFETLGLGIGDLMPKGWRNTTTSDLDELGLIAYSLELTTHYYITKQSDEEITDLLRVGLEYILAPGDEAADSADLVELPEQPKE
jgi:hypothetical protein